MPSQIVSGVPYSTSYTLDKMDKLFKKAVTKSHTLSENVWSFLHLTDWAL